MEFERFIEQFDYEVVGETELGHPYTVYCHSLEDAELTARMLLAPDEEIPARPGFMLARPKDERIITAIPRKRSRGANG